MIGERVSRPTVTMPLDFTPSNHAATGGVDPLLIAIHSEYGACQFGLSETLPLHYSLFDVLLYRCHDSLLCFTVSI